MDVHFWFETQTQLFPHAQAIDVIHARSIGSTRVHRFVLPEKDPPAILSQVLTKAEADARTHQGQQTYVLALIDLETGETASEYRLTLGDKDVGAAYDTELPNSEGIIKQLLRFNSNLHREARSAFKESQAALIQENERLRARCSNLEDRHQQVITLQEELMTLHHERELNVLRASKAEQRKDHALAQLTTFAPVVLHKLSGHLHGQPQPQQEPSQADPTRQPPANTAVSTPSPPNTLDPMIATLANSLSDDQIRALASILQPGQLAIAHELILKRRRTPEDVN